MSEERKLRVYTQEEIESFLRENLKEWRYEEGFLVRDITTKNWKETIFLVNAIAYVAEALWHHPDLEVSFKRLKIKLTTHEAKGITDRDFGLALEIERLLNLQRMP